MLLLLHKRITHIIVKNINTIQGKGAIIALNRVKSQKNDYIHPISGET